LLALGITSRVRNVEISKVLENLAKNYKAEFPFLIHYEEIKKLYDKLAQQYTYFQVMILKYMLDTISKKELDYYCLMSWDNNKLKELDFDPETKINDSLNRITNTGYLPISFDNPLKEPMTLKTDNRVVYNVRIFIWYRIRRDNK
jgi:hypothetical protein